MLRLLRCLLIAVSIATLLSPSWLHAQVSIAAARLAASECEIVSNVAGSTSALATRAAVAPVLDGKGSDAIWATAQVIDGFRTFDPVDNGEPRFDGEEDDSWDGVWRDVARFNERYSWPRFDRAKSGLASQLGDLAGIDGIASPRRLEIAPYTVAKTLNTPTATRYAQKGAMTMGADAKYGITSNLTLDATVNPDFGQIEADPSVLNLSAFETFSAHCALVLPLSISLAASSSVVIRAEGGNPLLSPSSFSPKAQSTPSFSPKAGICFSRSGAPSQLGTV